MDHVKNFYETILKSSHPLTSSLHLGFKAIPLVIYFLGSLMFHSFTTIAIFIILTISVDFYYTKNISGRKLVQLRWWYDENLTPPFKIESYKQYDQETVINPIDDKIFWWGLYGSFLIWCFSSIVCLMKFKLIYLVLVAFAIGLNYYNCRGFRTCYYFKPNGQASLQDSFNDIWGKVKNLNSLTTLFQQ